MKKIKTYKKITGIIRKFRTVLFIIPLFFLFPLISRAATFDYKLLESFPGVAGMVKDQTFTDLPGLVSGLYNFGIWTVGIAALLMLVIGGFMYMTSAGNTSRVATAKGVIGDALLGLVAALGAYLLLYVINPDLTKINLNLMQVDVSSQTSTTTTGGSATEGGVRGGVAASPSQVGCGKVVTAAQGQSNWVYDQGLRGRTVGGTHYTDCSNFAQSAYLSAGCKNPGSTTTDQYSMARSFSGSEDLKAGDILVRPKSGGKDGHAVVCITDGCGQMIHARGKSKGPPYVKTDNGSKAANKSGTWSNAKVVKAADMCANAKC